jgi:hypothetical protein
MTRKLKMLGLVLVALAAIGAAAAQGAAGEEEMTFTSTVEPTELTGSGGTHEWKIGGVTVKCSKATFTGSFATKTPDQMDLRPNYEGCTFTSKLGTTKATYENSGCKTDFDSDTSPNGNTEVEDGFVNLDCGNLLFSSSISTVIEGEAVVLDLVDTHPKEVPINQELHGATYSVLQHESLVPDEIEVHAHIFGLEFICTGEKCSKLGFKNGGTINAGTTLGTFIVSGYSDAAHKSQVFLGLTSP